MLLCKLLRVLRCLAGVVLDYFGDRFQGGVHGIGPRILLCVWPYAASSSATAISTAELEATPFVPDLSPLIGVKHDAVLREMSRSMIAVLPILPFARTPIWHVGLRLGTGTSPDGTLH